MNVSEDEVQVIVAEAVYFADENCETNLWMAIDPLYDWATADY